MSYFTKIAYEDSGSLDAFSRLRVSSPEVLFDTQCQYDADPIQMEGGATGTGVAPAHSADSRMVALTAATGTGTSFIQSYSYWPYQPGRSQFVAITGVLGTGVANTTVDTGLFDASNGIIFRQNGATNLQFILRTSTGGTVSDSNIVAQASWNIDPLNGNGPSGLSLDVTKAFILIIDLQFLGMGRVRVGFDINGVVYYAHEFLNANVLTLPYMQTATLPVAMLVTASTSGADKTSYFKCATVQTEGGTLQESGYAFSTPRTTATAGNNTRVPIMSIRPKTTFNSITNRSLFILEDIELLVTGVNNVFWELVVGGNYGGQAWSDIESTYSAFEYTSTPGTFTNLTGGFVLSSGFVSAATDAAFIRPFASSLRTPISLNRAGAARALGTLTLLVTGLSGASATQASINFKEIR